MDKWGTLINGVGLTGSKADWISQYAQMHTGQKIDFGGNMELNSFGTQSSEVFPSVLPMSIKVAAQTVGLDLVSVLPMNSNTDEELTIIKAEVEAENRNRKIDSLIEGNEYEEMKITEHPDFNTGPRGDLLYLDYSYKDPNTKKAD